MVRKNINVQISCAKATMAGIAPYPPLVPKVSDMKAAAMRSMKNIREDHSDTDSFSSLHLAILNTAGRNLSVWMQKSCTMKETTM